MRIKTLQISGFKSFVDRTRFAFEPGITAVVGPNGCGKSNVVDAVRWAMGEQAPRRLRGKSMEDVIFAGSEERAPIGLAEVTLSFDNADRRAPAGYADYSEIQVTRRLYRSGESEYLINKTPCRLRDVLDFFRDTGIGTRGYTIVEQGQIAAIVSSRPEDRRRLLEEAAGISKYKARRVEAERKLASTEQNLVRVSDVLGEIRRQLASIERQARKAARYKRLRERLRILELSLAADDRRALVAEIEGARSALAAVRAEAAAAEARAAERAAALEEARLALAERERAVGQGSEALYAVRSEIKQLESRMDYEQRERAGLAETRELRREELARLRERLATAEAEAREAEAELGVLEREVGQRADLLGAAEQEAQRAREAQRALEAAREAGNTELIEILTAVARAEDRLAALDERRSENQRRLRSADEALEVEQSEAARASREQSHLEQGLRNLLAERDRLMGALRGALARQQATADQLREAGERLGEARERREQRRARLGSLRELIEQHEDVGAGTRHLLGRGQEARRSHGLRALVRDVLEVEPDALPAVEAVLAERADALVASRAEGALSALDALRAAGAGRGVFVVEPRADGTPLGIVPFGEPLLERVRVQAGYEGVARALLGGVNLVESLREVVDHYGQGRLPATFVTPRGDVLGPDGVLQGGGDRVPGSLGRAQELRELEQEVDELERLVTGAERAFASARELATQATDEVENLRNRHHTAALAVASHEKDLERTRERVKVLGEAQEGRHAERSGLVSEIESLGGEASRLEASLGELRRRRADVQGRIEAAGGRMGAALREVERLDGALAERRVAHVAQVEKRDRLAVLRDRSRGAADEAREWSARREREIAEIESRRAELARSIQAAEAELTEKLRAEEAARVAADRVRDAWEREAEAIRSGEGEVRTLQAGMLAARERLQNEELRLRESELRLENLDSQVRERWAVELAGWSPPSAAEEAAAAAPDSDASDADEGVEVRLPGPPDAELAALAAEERRELLGDVRRRLESMGEVNLAAIEEHEELGERFRFLSEQKADLESTVASLREAIQRINRTSRKRFRETFEAVNARFRENFPRLFRGGKASLTLTESEDVLDAGIDIMAQPPGKRLQNVNLLSGGEKTLTALALLVSLFQVHPSPFFLLDEVDAALDDANVGRLNDIVKELAKESQFLLITHNKQTIEIADRLYGVTMEERGVSKLVGVELRDP